MQSIFNQVLCILITIQHYHVRKSPKQVLLCCFRLLDRLVNLYRSFRLLYRRSRTELRLLPKARRLWTKERRRHWLTSLLDRAIAIVEHRRRWTSKTVLRSKGSHGQRVTNAMILIEVLPLQGHISEVYLHLQLPLSELPLLL